MAERKNDSRVRRRVNLWIDRFFYRSLVLRTFTAVTFFVISFGVFSILLRRASDLGKFAIAAYGVFVILLCLVLIAEYVSKTVSLQRNNVKYYSTYLSINTIFGLIIPLFYSNVILAVVIRALGNIRNQGTLFCEFRCSAVSFYYNTDIYSQLNTIIFWLIIMTAVLFIFGGLLERLNRR